MVGTKRPLHVTHDGAELDACWQLTSLNVLYIAVDLSDATFVLRVGVSDGSGVTENWIGGTWLILLVEKGAGGFSSSSGGNISSDT